MLEVPHPQLHEVWPLFASVCAFILWIIIRPLLLWLWEGITIVRRYTPGAMRWLNFRLATYQKNSGAPHGQKSYLGRERRLSREELYKLSSALDKKKFQPWRHDYYMSLAMAVTGMIWIGGFSFLYAQHKNYLDLAVAMLSVAPFYFCSFYFERAQKRKHGKNPEIKAIQEFEIHAPEEWDVVPNQLMEKYGDIDLTVRLQNDEICVIAIKSWHSFKGFWKVRSALSQIQWRRRAAKASYGCIWLPDAHTSQANGCVLIVGGNAKFLIEQIRDFIRVNVSVEFPHAPLPDMLSELRNKGLRWNKAAVQWEGKISQRELTEIQHEITAHGGRVIIGADDREALMHYDSYDLYDAA